MPKYKMFWLNFNWSEINSSEKLLRANALPTDEIIKLIEHRAFVDAQNKLDKILDYCEPHTEQMWAALVCSVILECDFKESAQKLIQFRQEIEGE